MSAAELDKEAPGAHNRAWARSQGRSLALGNRPGRRRAPVSWEGPPESRRACGAGRPAAPAHGSGVPGQGCCPAWPRSEAVPTPWPGDVRSCSLGSLLWKPRCQPRSAKPWGRGSSAWDWTDCWWTEPPLVASTGGRQEGPRGPRWPILSAPPGPQGTLTRASSAPGHFPAVLGVRIQDGARGATVKAGLSLGRVPLLLPAWVAVATSPQPLPLSHRAPAQGSM